VKLGLRGGIGPLRAGVSTRGFRIGAGPLSASSTVRGLRGRASASGDAAVIFAVLMVILAVSLAVSWPYFIGSWLATVMGAGRHSTTRTIVGAAAEGFYGLLWLLYALGSAAESKTRRANERQAAADEETVTLAAKRRELGVQYEEKRIQANAARDVLIAASEQCGERLAWLKQHPGGVTAPGMREDEKLYVRYTDAGLCEPRSMWRGGPREQTVIERGSVTVTSQRVSFSGSTRTREWRWDRLPDLKFVDEHILMPVSSRQTVSGITPNIVDFAAAATVFLWAFGTATGRGVADAIDTAAGLQAEAERSLRENPPLGPPDESIDVL
jgi:hypothetical protein